MYDDTAAIIRSLSDAELLMLHDTDPDVSFLPRDLRNRLSDLLAVREVSRRIELKEKHGTNKGVGMFRQGMRLSNDAADHAAELPAGDVPLVPAVSVDRKPAKADPENAAA